MQNAATAIDYYRALLPGRSDAPTDMLKRIYDVTPGGLNWPTTAAAGTLLGSFDPYAQLTQQQVVGDALRHFRYLRSGAKLHVRVNTNKFMYGRLAVFWTPEYFDPGSGSPAAWNGLKLAELDANSVEGVDFVAPYVFRDPSIDMRVPPVSPLGRFHIGVIAPLRSISSGAITTNLSITTFMQFTDPVLDGPLL